jgi:PAS domain S-box-containing protein
VAWASLSSSDFDPERISGPINLRHFSLAAGLQNARLHASQKGVVHMRRRVLGAAAAAWKRAERPTALLHEAGYLLLGLVSLATVTGLYFWLDVPLVAAAFTYLVVLVLLALVGNLSSLIVLSFIGVGCLSYFFAPPIYSLRVDYPQDLITISAFVITSFVVNFLVTRVRGEQRDHMRAQEALRESERSSRSALDGIAGLIAIINPNGEIETVNRQVFEYFGRSLEELKNWGTNDTVHPEDLPHVVEMFTRAMASGMPYHYDQRLRRFDGEYRWFENRGVPIRDASGRIARWYVLLTDIEDRTRALARLEQMQSDFAHINRVSTMGQLTASITHEVNQPITAAVTYALAARRWLSAEPPNFHEVDDALSLIVKEGNRAGEVVGRIRALVKKVPVRKDAVAIDDAILEIIALTRTEAANNSVSVRTQFAEGLPPVQGDRVQLQQVMLNLIVNAIQAMSGIGEGARELRISIEAVPSEAGVRVGVRDTGPGLSPESLSRLFEPFYTTKPEGMGMGLSICRSIIEAHGGRLWAIPCEPQGALFQFTIPAT